ncbi:MAG: dihydroneopterin aldolase [Rickettsiales bacterium]|nr:dihydroneopterin aldolase [Rickettsiales bacterium]
MLCTGLSFILDVYIGVTVEERKKIQPLEVRFEFQNNQDIQSKINDNSLEYVCYKKIVEEVCAEFSNTEIKLLEYVCYQIYKIIKSHVSKGMLVNVSVKKICHNIIHGNDAEATCRYIEFLGCL